MGNPLLGTYFFNLGILSIKIEKKFNKNDVKTFFDKEYLYTRTNDKNAIYSDDKWSEILREIEIEKNINLTFIGHSLSIDDISAMAIKLDKLKFMRDENMIKQIKVISFWIKKDEKPTFKKINKHLMKLSNNKFIKGIDNIYLSNMFKDENLILINNYKKI